MTKKRIVHLAIMAVALVAVVLLAVLLPKTETVVCPACGGSAECATCEGDGLHSPEEGSGICCACTGSGICPDCEGAGTVPSPSMYYGTFMSLVPPLIAILLALITKEVYSSLFVGILAGAIFYGNYEPARVLSALTEDGLISAVSGTAGIFIFLCVLGVFVVLVNRAGGSAAFGRWAATHIKTKTGAMLATFVLGVLIFIDDYFNCLTVGSVMRPVTDSKGISRAKLAYLIDATAAPICMIAPISSWAAAVSQYVEDGQGFRFFVLAIPFNFYSILTLVFIIALSVLCFDFGKMAMAEKAGGGAEAEAGGEAAPVANEKGRISDLIAPIGVLIVCCVVTLLFVGGFFGGDYAWDVVGAFGNTDATVALPMGSLVALLVTMVYFYFRKLVTFKEIASAIPKGFVAMVPAILILTLATSLKNITGCLGSDVFVAEILQNAGTLQAFLPAIIFVIACVLAFSTGTSWGTFGILIPIVSTGLGLGTEIGLVAMSACLAGAVCGDHCSPISDTTIMSSAGAGCNHLDHVSTQLPYAITVATVSFVSYVITGILSILLPDGFPLAVIALPLAIVLMVGTILVIRAIVKKKESGAA